MRVLLIGMGGISTAFRNAPESTLARALIARGHQVYSYSYLNPGWPVDQLREEQVDGTQIRRVAAGRMGLSFDLWQAMHRDALPDIVHIHHLRNEFLRQALIFYQRRGVPVVLTPHGVLHDRFLTDNRDDPFSSPLKTDNLIFNARGYFRHLAREFTPRKHLANWLTHSALERPNHFVALTEFEKGILNRLGIPESKISVVPNSIDLEFIDSTLSKNELAPGLNYSRPRILFIGQLKFRKGFDLLIRAAPKVRAVFPDASFLFVSYNLSQRDAFMRLVDQAGARDYVYLIQEPGGASAEADKTRRYAGSDVFVLPTRYEGFGLPLIEAMACRVPVVSTRIPGVIEVLEDGQEGLLAALNDPDDLASKIIQVLGDPMLRRRLTLNGRRRVETCYTQPLLGEKTEQVYCRVLASRQQKVPLAAAV